MLSIEFLMLGGIAGVAGVGSASAAIEYSAAQAGCQFSSELGDLILRHGGDGNFVQRHWMARILSHSATKTAASAARDE